MECDDELAGEQDHGDDQQGRDSDRLEQWHVLGSVSALWAVGGFEAEGTLSFGWRTYRAERWVGVV